MSIIKVYDKKRLTMLKNGRNNYEPINMDIVNYYIKTNESYTASSDEVKLKLLKNKLAKLKEIKDADEAKAYVSEFLPTENTSNYFSVSNARGLVLRDRKYFRVILDCEDEYICYNYLIKS